jgi:glutamine synthetase
MSTDVKPCFTVRDFDGRGRRAGRLENGAEGEATVSVETQVPLGRPARDPSAVQDLAARAREDGVRFLLALFVDLTGKPCAKLVPVEAAGALQHEGVGFAGFAVGAIGQQPCDPDLIAIPDLASYTPLPWVRDGLALVHCDPHVEGQPWRFAPRVILKSVLERAQARHLELFAGAEVEYFLVSRGADGRLAPADSKDVEARPCYDARGLTRMYEHLTGVSSAMNALGWANYANDHEDANGQFEQNFAYADALTTADRVITARYLISMLAEQRGMTATFMPKPFDDRTGSGLHLHLSLWREGTPLFSSERDSRSFGLSELAYRFLAGILEHAPGLQAVLAPTVNSYKRTGATSTRSGATWSPRRASYGGNDRTHYVRIPEGNRIELRGGDGSANPYLALAATLTAGLDGIDRELDPGPPGTGTDAPARPELPPTLLHAVEAMTGDPVVGAALDAAGPGVAEYFAALKRDEFFDWHSTVGPWEHDRYLTAF